MTHLSFRFVLLCLWTVLLTPSLQEACGRGRRHSDTISPSDSLSIEIAPEAESSVPHRADPLNGLKKYRGGYDIQNKHYWASAVFTGIAGYTIALAVLLLGLALLSLLVVRSLKRTDFRWEKITYDFTRSYYVFFTVALVVATALALAFSSMILAGNERLHEEAKNVEDIIIGAANNATETIYNLTSVLSEISTTLRPFTRTWTGNLTASTAILSSQTKLYVEGKQIQHRVNDNKRTIDISLNQIYVAIIVTISLTMFSLIAGLGIMNFTKPEKLHLRTQAWWWFFSLNTLIFWILTIFSWIAFGLSLAVFNVVDDSCSALRDYQQDPYSSNALGSVLPCVSMKSGNDSVLKLREGMYSIIVQANRNISKLRTGNGDNRVIPHICNPFSGPPHYKLTGRCLEGTVTIGSVPRALQPFRCPQDDDKYCVSAEGGHIPNSIYRIILAYSTAAQTLIDATPSLERLANCSFVLHAFSVIVDEKCAPIMSSVHLIWASFAGLSTMASILLVFYVKELLYMQIKASDTNTLHF